MTFRWVSMGACVYTQILHCVIIFVAWKKRLRWEQCFQRWVCLCVGISHLCHLLHWHWHAIHRIQEHIPPIPSIVIGALLTYKVFLGDPYVLSAQWRTISIRRTIGSVASQRELRKVGRGPWTPKVIGKTWGLGLVRHEVKSNFLLSASSLYCFHPYTVEALDIPHLWTLSCHIPAQVLLEAGIPHILESLKVKTNILQGLLKVT